MRREWTTDECREAFLDKVRVYVRYWAAIPDQTPIERLAGLAHSILVILDGGAADLPGFIVAPFPHSEDRAFHESEGENWWPENDYSAVKADIAGDLHELLFRGADGEALARQK